MSLRKGERVQAEVLLSIICEGRRSEEKLRKGGVVVGRRVAR